MSESSLVGSGRREVRRARRPIRKPTACRSREGVTTPRGGRSDGVGRRPEEWRRPRRALVARSAAAVASPWPAKGAFACANGHLLQKSLYRLTRAEAQTFLSRLLCD